MDPQEQKGWRKDQPLRLLGWATLLRRVGHLAAVRWRPDAARKPHLMALGEAGENYRLHRRSFDLSPDSRLELGSEAVGSLLVHRPFIHLLCGCYVRSECAPVSDHTMVH